MSAHGHKHTGSVTQNHKAQLANAYNELGKELLSSKIRVVGNYTLGKVIGEGKIDMVCCIVSGSDLPAIVLCLYCRGLWKSTTGHS